MGLFDWLWRWMGWLPAEDDPPSSGVVRPRRAESPSAVALATRTKVRAPVRLVRMRRRSVLERSPVIESRGKPPYRFARLGSRTGHYLDLSQDGDEEHLRAQQLPVLTTPDDIAAWVGQPVGRLAWLVHRFTGGRPRGQKQAHYWFRWMRKKSGGWRLIEAPKPDLKAVQVKILTEILDRCPPHNAAHGFVAGRSIVSNAARHTGQAVVVRFDLENFYPAVSFSRVVAIFRSIGYSREAAIWLGRLTTSAVPGDLALPEGDAGAVMPYLRAHLPQGAPTSPALANLSAFVLDLRLAGLSRTFGATYTRYADDLTFSGDAKFRSSLRVFLPLVNQIIREERFRVHRKKRRILRPHQQQRVTGVVVNVKPNQSRSDFDRLKAILHNCVKLGPSSQNHDGAADFAGHLRGRIAHACLLNRSRGEKLLAVYQRIDWTR